MSVTTGTWQTEGDHAVLRLDPAVLTDAALRARVVAWSRAQQTLRPPGLARVLDLVQREDADGAAVWLVVDGAASPPFEPLSAPPATVVAVLARTAEILAGLHAAGRAHGGLRADDIVVSPEVRLLGAGLRPALDGAGEDAAADVMAWAELAEASAEALAGRDDARCAALLRAAARARRAGLASAVEILPPAAVADPVVATPVETDELPRALPAGATILGRGAPTPPDADGLLRAGPGVPEVARTGRRAATPGRGHRRGRRRGRRLLTSLGTLLFVAAVALGVLWWRGELSTLHVTDVTVTAPPVSPCGDTVDVAGRISTDGGTGLLTYHWLRNDGVDSGPVDVHVRPWQRSVVVHLRWRLQGEGRFRATATLDVTTPTEVRATTHFTWSCAHVRG
ncbi:MAG: hypothetical protein ACTHMS_01510 [Jatrophihabitans sp.]|uniref:hypothetical protein n=1 Tax=Jatrophihabitans sp. TaxID=1932789 RepID=UPI003F7F4BF8